jgi:hypothetical protein
LIPAQIVAFISITGSTSVPVNNPQQIVAFAQQGLVSSMPSANYKQCVTASSDSSTQPSPLPSFTFSEGFASSFKTVYQTLAAATGLVGRGPAGTPSTPGVAYYDEGGFMTSVAGVGSASQGTQLQVVFTNIPSGATVNVPKSAPFTTTLPEVAPDGIDAEHVATGTWIAHPDWMSQPACS